MDTATSNIGGGSGISGDSSTNLATVIKGLKKFDGKDPAEVKTWMKKFWVVLGVTRKDILSLLKEQKKPDPADAAAFESHTKANEDLYAVLFLLVELSAALSTQKHEDDTGISGDGQAAFEELCNNYDRVTDEVIRAKMEELENNPMNPSENPEDYLNQKHLLRAQLQKMGEPISDRHFKDICVQGFSDEYKDVKLMVYRDPTFNVLDMQSTHGSNDEGAVIEFTRDEDAFDSGFMFTTSEYSFRIAGRNFAASSTGRQHHCDTVYADDIPITGGDEKLVDQKKKELTDRFEMVDMGEVKRILGIDVQRDYEQGALAISQEHHVKTPLELFGMKEANRSAEDLARMMTVIVEVLREFRLTVSERKTETLVMRVKEKQPPLMPPPPLIIEAAGQRPTYSIKEEAVEALLYDCVTWSPRGDHYRLLQTTHHQLLLRIIGHLRKRGTHRQLSYAQALRRVGCQSVEATIRQRRLFVAGAVARQPDKRLPKRLMFDELAGGEKLGKGSPEQNWLPCLKDDLRVFGATHGSTDEAPCVFGP
eukprot:g10808.t1